jgi:hypothetical protein
VLSYDSANVSEKYAVSIFRAEVTKLGSGALHFPVYISSIIRAIMMMVAALHFPVCISSIIRAIMMMVAARTSETSVYSNETTWRYIPSGSHLHTAVRT